MTAEVIKKPFRRILALSGLKLVRVDKTFGMDPIADIIFHFPEKRIATVVDVGANIGSFASNASRRLPGAQVLAFEPVHGTFEACKQNTRALKNVRPFHLALGDCEGEATVYIQDHSEWNSIAPAVNLPREGARSEVVRVTTLDRLFHEGLFQSIDVLKTDTEGFDINVLNGASELFNLRRVGFVLSEIAYDKDDKCHTNFFALHEFLGRFAFELFGIYDQTIQPGKRSAGYCNALFVSPSPG